MENNEKKVLLSLRNVVVKFNVRGRILTAIRHVSLDIYEHESLAIVGESGSGKSVLTKTFAGMLDSNGFIPEGTIILSDDEISETAVQLTGYRKTIYDRVYAMINKHSRLERGAEAFNAYNAKKEAIRHAKSLSLDEEADFTQRLKLAKDDIVDQSNFLMTLDKRADAEDYAKTEAKIQELTAKRKAIEVERDALIKQRAADYKSHPERAKKDQKELDELRTRRAEKIAKADNESNPQGLSDKVLARNKILANEVLLSIGRYPLKDQIRFVTRLDKAFKVAMATGEDLDDPEVRNKIFEVAGFRVEYRSFDEETQTLHGYAIIDCAKVKYTNDWQQIRGCRIATVFQDPMTSLNPVITIGKQIMTVIQKHQKCSNAEARKRTLDIMEKVGIPDPEKRFDDYPFEYSGGMRQRIVIAMQKDLGFTTVYITHDLGVVANVAERVAVLYGGQIVEMGTVEEIFYEPKHPYTWALLSSLPQLSERGSDLFYIPGTPPSLYNKIVGDAFAPRSQYAMAIDLKEEPPMFQVSPTHFAKTWLLDPRAPKTEPPANIQNLHEKIKKTYVDFGA